MTAHGTTHFFTVDVEEYFQVSAFEPYAPRDRWPSFEPRLDQSMDWLLETLARAGVTGTFFTLGWVARNRPGIVKRIAAAGHEVASHGFWHRRITTLSPAEFRQDLRDAKDALEQESGQPVRGFRAPSFSIVPGGEWALEILAEEGHTYDSSLFPFGRKGYGYPGVMLDPHTLVLPNGSSIYEFPMTMAHMLGRKVPASGGGWFRQFPYGITRLAFAQHSEAKMPGMFYIHPWEVDPNQPRLKTNLVTRLRHYRGLGVTRERIERLLREFRFTSIRDGLAVAKERTSRLGAAA